MRTITISKLKNNLSAEIKKLKKNGALEILQRDVPVARLVPLEKKESLKFLSHATRKFELRKSPIEVDFDPIADLLEERRKDRM
ncbi:MAG: hypothetical protein LDLANPLL_01485 [Turneriella sp.]|nr:hypothetical protein [Turneriella sp.]